jgi:hypothetical protein
MRMASTASQFSQRSSSAARGLGEKLHALDHGRALVDEGLGLGAVQLRVVRGAIFFDIAECFGGRVHENPNGGDHGRKDAHDVGGGEGFDVAG